MAQLRVPVCFDISRYLTDKDFDIVWGCHPPGTPKNYFFERLNLGSQFVYCIYVLAFGIVRNSHRKSDMQIFSRITQTLCSTVMSIGYIFVALTWLFVFVEFPRVTAFLMIITLRRLLNIVVDCFFLGN